MAEQQTQNTAIVGEKKVPPTDEVEEGPESKVESPVPPVEKASTPELTESPEVVAAMTVQLTTAKTETDALLGAIKEISDSLEGVDGQEGTSKLIKVMLLGLKTQRSISQIGSIEMKQVAVKQLDLLRHVASGFSDQTELLQTLSDDIGANLNQLAQSFVKLSDVIKDGYKQSKDGGTDTENRHRQMLEKLDSQNVYFLHIRNGINSLVKALTNLQWTAEELRTGVPPSSPIVHLNLPSQYQLKKHQWWPLSTDGTAAHAYSPVEGMVSRWGMPTASTGASTSSGADYCWWLRAR